MFGMIILGAMRENVGSHTSIDKDFIKSSGGGNMTGATGQGFKNNCSILSRAKSTAGYERSISNNSSSEK